MHSAATTDQVDDLRQRIHELELKMISVSGQEARHEISVSGLERRHETWRDAFLDMLGVMMVVVTFLFTFLAATLPHRG